MGPMPPRRGVCRSSFRPQNPRAGRCDDGVPIDVIEEGVAKISCGRLITIIIECERQPSFGDSSLSLPY